MTPFWIAAAFAAAMIAPSAGAAELRVAYEDKSQFPNYVGDGPDVPDRPGVSVELVRLAAESLGHQVRLQRWPWSRCLLLLKEGKVDGIFNSSFKTERLENGVYPMKDGKPDAARRITTISYSLYRRIGTPVTWNGKGFDGLTGTIGAPLGFSIVDDLTKLGVKVEPAPDTTLNLKKLQAGRLIGVAAQDITADQLLAGGGFTDLEKVAPPIVQKDYFLMLSHQLVAADPVAAEQIWTRLGELRASETARLAAKYAE